MNQSAGGTLEALLRSNEIITWKVLHEIAQGIAEGLHYLHKEKIIHRDLVSNNIFLRGKYIPLISDFGISKSIPRLPEKPDPEFLKRHEKVRIPHKWMVGTTSNLYF